jgi:uncharacterized phage-associated protein
MILSIANYILQYAANGENNITHLKLQKLLYYVKAWSLVNGTPVIPESFLKWKHGPVNKQIYDEYKKYGDNVISHTSSGSNNVMHKELIDFILECYAPYDAINLSLMTHQDDPWKNTPDNSVISDASMLKYYSLLPFAKNFPVDSQKPFYPVDTNMHYAFIFDMDEKTVEQNTAYPSFSAYKQHVAKARRDVDQWLSKIAQQQ